LNAPADGLLAARRDIGGPAAALPDLMFGRPEARRPESADEGLVPIRLPFAERAARVDLARDSCGVIAVVRDRWGWRRAGDIIGDGLFPPDRSDARFERSRNGERCSWIGTEDPERGISGTICDRCGFDGRHGFTSLTGAQAGCHHSMKMAPDFLCKTRQTPGAAVDDDLPQGDSCGSKAIRLAVGNPVPILWTTAQMDAGPVANEL
jgi:hypothetical protein